MKTKFIFAFLALVFTTELTAQRVCGSYGYNQQQLKNEPSLANKANAIEAFIQHQLNTTENIASRTDGSNSIIKIPVVVHILYHQSVENISDAQVISQITALNKAFRRQGADTINTPARFKPYAADCEIEFQLATSDPKRRSTNGIIRKYSPVGEWEADDKMKLSSEMGDDAWDAKSYLNIWVCNLDQVAGYSSAIGGPAEKDGVVIGLTVFGSLNAGAGGYDMGKTGVHEVGHWLGLKHLWGDENCGDDGVSDTPKQAGYNINCPTGIRISCNNGPDGDMYMDYMDFTSDACMNIFTLGQKARMRALFATGGLRNSILSSVGLSVPLIAESSLPDDSPKWLHPQLYPNPVTTELTIDLAYDIRWIGKTIAVTNLTGQVMMQVPVTAKYQKIDISKLKPGMYFLNAKKENGDFIKEKVIKL